MGHLFGKSKWCPMVCSAWLLGSPAHAQPPARQFVNLEYEVDSALRGCPTAAEFRALIERQLGYDPYRPDSSLGVRVRVKSAETGIEGTIEWTSAAQKRVGERHFASPNRDCRDTTATMGFVVAVQIQLMATEPASESVPQPVPTEPTPDHDSPPGQAPEQAGRMAVQPKKSTTGRLAQPMRPAESSPPWSLTGGAGPAVGFGLGPDPVVEGRLFFGFELGQAALELGGEASLPATTRLASGAGFSHGLLLGTLAACGSYGSIAGCGVTKLGSIQVTGVGVDKPASPAGFVTLVGPRLMYSFRLDDHLVLSGRIEALYQLAPWSVVLNHVAVWSVPRLSTVAGIDFAARFP